MKSLAGIDTFVQNLFVSGALLDREGVILDVSEGWRQFAASGKLKLKKYGIGENYLKHVIFSDETSVSMLRGLKSVLNKKIDVFSTIYPCDTEGGRRWFILVAFALDGNPAAAAVLHVDITPLLGNPAELSAVMEGVGPAAMDSTVGKLINVVRRSIAEGLKVTDKAVTSGSRREQAILRSLTPHQLSLLRELALGATNSEIARVHSITLNSAKSQTAALFKKLGVSNRTQAALLAARNGLAVRPSEAREVGERLG